MKKNVLLLSSLLLVFGVFPSFVAAGDKTVGEKALDVLKSPATIATSGIAALILGGIAVRAYNQSKNLNATSVAREKAASLYKKLAALGFVAGGIAAGGGIARFMDKTPSGVGGGRPTGGNGLHGGNQLLGGTSGQSGSSSTGGAFSPVVLPEITAETFKQVVDQFIDRNSIEVVITALRDVKIEKDSDLWKAIQTYRDHGKTFAHIVVASQQSSIDEQIAVLEKMPRSILSASEGSDGYSALQKMEAVLCSKNATSDQQLAFFRLIEPNGKMEKDFFDTKVKPLLTLVSLVLNRTEMYESPDFSSVVTAIDAMSSQDLREVVYYACKVQGRRTTIIEKLAPDQDLAVFKKLLEKKALYAVYCSYESDRTFWGRFMTSIKSDFQYYKEVVLALLDSLDCPRGKALAMNYGSGFSISYYLAKMLEFPNFNKKEIFNDGIKACAEANIPLFYPALISRMFTLEATQRSEWLACLGDKVGVAAQQALDYDYQSPGKLRPDEGGLSTLLQQESLRKWLQELVSDFRK